MPRPAGAGTMDSATLFSLEAAPANPSVATEGQRARLQHSTSETPEAFTKSSGRLPVDAHTAEHPLGSRRRLAGRREGARPLQSALEMGPVRGASRRWPLVLG